MSKTRNLSDLLDANGDVKSTALDNVPASNDASALTTGTLPDARLSTNVTQNSSTQTLTNKTINASSNTLSNIPNSALTNSSITINGSATSLGGSTTINTDLVNDTTPQLGGDLDTNGNNISLPDSNGSTTNQIKLGTSNDLQIFHDGSNSWIKDVGTGSLVLQGTNLLIRTNNGDNVITATENAEVTLAYDNATKLETTSSGATVTGTLTATAFSGDGSALTNVPAGLSAFNIVTITSSGTYTPTSGTKFVRVYACGGGGAGGGTAPGSQAEFMAGGGTGGNTGVRDYTASELGSSASVTIGSGGSGSSGGDGGNGGTTSFNPAGSGTTVTGAGGVGAYSVGDDGTPSYAKTRDTTTTGALYTIYGNYGFVGGRFRRGGSTYYVSGGGGESFFGVGGAYRETTGQINVAGNSGHRGGGGGGALNRQYANNNPGGSGGAGIVVIEEYA